MQLTSTPNRIDQREGLWNGRPVGPVTQIQVPAERITRLDGILLDFDPPDYQPGNPWFMPDSDPRKFHDQIRRVLERHPLARRAEVRASGSGLHVIIWLSPPVLLETAAAQKYWRGIVRAVQSSLPTDPNAPGITATTRAVGSINSKNGVVVEVLRQGESVSPDQVIEFVARVVKAPFKEIATILLGGTQARPCPVCGEQDSHLDVLDHVGRCYHHCGKVKLEKLLETVFVSTAEGKKEEGKMLKSKRKTKRTTTKKPKLAKSDKTNVNRGTKPPATRQSGSRKGKVN